MFGREFESPQLHTLFTNSCKDAMNHPIYGVFAFGYFMNHSAFEKPAGFKKGLSFLNNISSR